MGLLEDFNKKVEELGIDEIKRLWDLREEDDNIGPTIGEVLSELKLYHSIVDFENEKHLELKGLIYEDDLPDDMTDEEYTNWFKRSHVVDGVRMGYPIDDVPKHEECDKKIHHHLSPFKYNPFFIFPV
jgi:hypothetical protein